MTPIKIKTNAAIVKPYMQVDFVTYFMSFCTYVVINTENHKLAVTLMVKRFGAFSSKVPSLYC